MKPITMYYVPTCPDSAAAASLLFLEGADFRLVNLEQHPEAVELVKRAAGGNVSTPTIEVDGEWLVEPSPSVLRERLAGWGLPVDAAPHERVRRLR